MFFRRLRRRPVDKDFRVTAIISVREDALYLDRCFRCMAENGVHAIVIDNDADAQTRHIIEQYRDEVVVDVVPLAHNGVFDWGAIMACKEHVANTYASSWFMLWDSDELREAPLPGQRLVDALKAEDQKGYSCVNFDEYVFLPVSETEDHGSGDYYESLRTYYYFAPRPLHRITAWKAPRGYTKLVKYGGHDVKFRGKRISSSRFAMRHYLFLSFEHGVRKYGTRRYTKADLDRGWSRERAETPIESFRLPRPDEMKIMTEAGVWDRSNPLSRHPSFS